MDMTEARQAQESASGEQLRYARLMDVGVKLGFALLVAGLALYLSGLLPSHVPPQDLPRYWNLPVEQYLARTGTPTGWGWLALLPAADMLSLAAIAALSGVTLVCFVALVPLFARRGERAFAVIAAVEIAVLLLAASGILTAGH